MVHCICISIVRVLGLRLMVAFSGGVFEEEGIGCHVIW